jgi:type IV pilus assembly protein PilA
MRRHPDRAFTLIEVMIVVAIVGVLAVIATVSYRRWKWAAYLSEAQNMVSNIRSAEESFKAENGGYWDTVSNGLGPGSDYPAPTPGAFKTGWGGPCTVCTPTNAWQRLSVQPDGPVVYGFSLLADHTGASTPHWILINGAQVTPAMPTGSPWYVIEADGDPAGTGHPTQVFATNGNNEIFVNFEQ